MSSDLAIKIDNISKCYHIYDTPYDRLKQFLLPRLKKRASLPPRQYFHEFWALRNVSFEIRKGGTVGIIGRNGSGKSTLLQIICGTLTPTAGSVQTNGRIAALLELGSGFNPEYTGRENVYMNAAVLGLSKEDTHSRFDDISAFADIGEFIDQPVKTYSSGMVVRLAFSVIAHVKADILVVDEALSVGDFVFTQKCMRYLREFMEKGTLVFVSHDTNSVTNLCESAVWLERGKIRLCGAATQVAEEYVQANLQEVYGKDVQLEPVNAVEPENTEQVVADAGSESTTSYEFYDAIANTTGWKSGAAEILSVRMLDDSGNSVLVSRGGEKVCVEIKARCLKEIYSPIIGFFLKDRLGQALFGENSYDATRPPLLLPEGKTVVAKFRFELPLLPNGEYSMTIAIAEGTLDRHVQHHWLHDAVLLTVASTVPRYGLVGIPFEEVSVEVIDGDEG